MDGGWGSVGWMASRHPRWRTTALGAIAFLSAGAFCATAPLRPSGGRWVHPKLGYSIDAPQVSPEEWSASHVEGADLAFRKFDGSSLTLMSDCTRGPAKPFVLARQLMIGIKQRELIQSHPIALLGDPGWRLAFRTIEAGREVTVRAVTLASGNCTFDWLWVALNRPDEAAWFDQWWASFERGPRA